MRVPREALFPLFAVIVALAVTLAVRHAARNAKPPAPPSAVSRLAGAVNHLLYGHGCPDRALNPKSMECEYDAFRIRMSFYCKVTGERVTTEMVAGTHARKEDFAILQLCGDASVILWKPAHIAFGVRNLKIELMSRDPDQIIELMCGGSANATPATGGSPGGGAGLPRGFSEAPTRTPTAKPR